MIFPHLWHFEVLFSKILVFEFEGGITDSAGRTRRTAVYCLLNVPQFDIRIDEEAVGANPSRSIKN
jgi:hypothetical protein